MDLLWSLMGEIYAYRWSKSYGMPDQGAYQTWMEGLIDLSPKDIRRGIAGCVKRPDKWPPSLPEFRALCNGGGDHPVNAQMYRRPEYLSLPRPVPSYDRARPFIQSMRSHLGRSG